MQGFPRVKRFEESRNLLVRIPRTLREVLVAKARLTDRDQFRKLIIALPDWLIRYVVADLPELDAVIDEGHKIRGPKAVLTIEKVIQVIRDHGKYHDFQLRWKLQNPALTDGKALNS